MKYRCIYNTAICCPCFQLDEQYTRLFCVWSLNGWLIWLDIASKYGKQTGTASINIATFYYKTDEYTDVKNTMLLKSFKHTTLYSCFASIPHLNRAYIP